MDYARCYLMHYPLDFVWPNISKMIIANTL